MKRDVLLISCTIVLLALCSPAPAPAHVNHYFYVSVPWGIPAGLQSYTVPTKFAPSTDGTTGYLPICKTADCGMGMDGSMTPEFKSIHQYIRDYTAKVIAGAKTPEEAAKKIFYEVRDKIEYEDSTFFGAFMAYKYRVGNMGMKASLANAMYRSAKIPARLVIEPSAITPKYLGYNASNSTSAVNDSTLASSAFGSSHIYSEVYINGKWVICDAAWDSALAEAFDIPTFGKKCKNYKALGTANVDADYSDLYLSAQPHPYLFEQTVDPVTYNEDTESDMFLYFRSTVSPLNQYLKNVRYRSTMKNIAGVVNYGIAETQQLSDLSKSGSADFVAATNAMSALKSALKSINDGNLPAAKNFMVSAQNYLHQISTFWNNEDILTLRYRLATLTNMGKKIGVIAPSEANPPTYNYIEPYDNTILNWQVLYGYDTWDKPEMTNYIMENLYLATFPYMGVPIKIATITEDKYTILFDPNNTVPAPDYTPMVLSDHFGKRYDPMTTPYVYDGLTMGYNPFLSKEPVYDLPVPNGVPDFFEAVANARLSRYRMQGGWEWQRARQWPDDMKVANRLLDTYSNVNMFFFFGMDNQVFEDIVHRITDSGTPNLLLNASNNLYAEFTWAGYRYELGNYIKSSSNPGIKLYECPTYGKYDVYIKGLVAALEQEMENYPDGARTIVSLVSHGFPYIDLLNHAFGYPGCSSYLVGSPYGCPIEPPYECGFDMSDPNFWTCLRQPGKFIFPTGYIYAEDPWHQNNWDQFDLILDEIANNHPALFAKLDSNGDGNIKYDELWLSGNMYSGGSYDPYDLFAGTEEWFINHTKSDGMGGSINLGPILKNKMDEDGVDYFVDIPYFWDKESTETLMHRMMLFGGADMEMSESMSGHNMIWIDDNIRSETMFMPADHTMHGWSATDPMINVTVTRMLLEGSQALQDAMAESYADGISLIP